MGPALLNSFLEEIQKIAEDKESSTPLLTPGKALAGAGLAAGLAGAGLMARRSHLRHLDQMKAERLQRYARGRRRDYALIAALGTGALLAGAGAKRLANAMTRDAMFDLMAKRASDDMNEGGFTKRDKQVGAGLAAATLLLGGMGYRKHLLNRQALEAAAAKAARDEMIRDYATRGGLALGGALGGAALTGAGALLAAATRPVRDIAGAALRPVKERAEAAAARKVESVLNRQFPKPAQTAAPQVSPTLVPPVRPNKKFRRRR